MGYSQVGQDEWVLSLFPEGYKGFFMDIGCNDPKKINNTLLLEEHGWTGVAFDIMDFSYEWRKRKALFIKEDVIRCDFNQFNLPKDIDYLSLDVDNIGTNCFVMKRLIDFGFVFKAITIEHNIYGGEQYDICERIPQRELLLHNGYTLAKPDVSDEVNKFEDWWTHV